MKKLFLIIPMIFILVSAQGQSRKVKERDLDGVWKLVIDIKEDEIQEELDEEDNAFARLFAKSVIGMVDGILDELDIKFEFKPGGKLKVTVNAFGEEEIEYSTWYINNRGQLIIEDSDSFQSDDNDYWMFEGDILVSFDEGSDEPEENAYLVNLDD